MMQLLTIGEYSIFSIMGFASILALAVAIEKSLLYSQTAGKNGGILNSIIIDFISGKISAAGKYAEKSSKNVYARFASFIKENYNSGPGAMEHLMEAKMIEERIFLEKRLIVLGSLGNNAPFIGLLGTVLGIIKAFYNLGALGNAGAELVMKSISTALVATAGGLLIAIPVVIANNYFNRKVKVIMQNMEQIAKSALASYSVKEER